MKKQYLAIITWVNKILGKTWSLGMSTVYPSTQNILTHPNHIDYNDDDDDGRKKAKV